MPIYSVKCSKCDFTNPELSVPSFDNLKESVCPKCNSKVEQVYDSCNFKINGYSYNNVYKGDPMYRDIGKEKRSVHSVGK
jgi:predicted nucleic acid-binding Zn ribbon protein